MQAKLIFITGTNTGTGKTLLSCLVLNHLRKKKHNAAGLKPFCSGSRSDAHHIHAQMDKTWTLEEINPWYFKDPLSPGAMPKRLHVSKDMVAHHIVKKQSECSHLIVEGAGGIMSPLGSEYHFGDLIQPFNPEILCAAPNKLGVLNQVLLTHDYLKRIRRTNKLKFVLMGQKKPDPSSDSNAKVLRQWIPDCRVIEIPYLGSRAKSQASIELNAKKLSTTLKSLFAT